MIIETLIHLLQQNDLITDLFQIPNDFQHIPVMVPCYALFGAEGGFRNLRLRRKTGDAAQPDFLHSHSVGGAKDGAHIVKAADVIKNNGYGNPRFRQFFLLAGNDFVIR